MDPNNSNNDEVPQRVVINVGNIIASITKKNAVIFCRVSSFGQTGKYCISFEVQEHKGNVCAKLFGLKVMGVFKIVESAFQGKACTIKSLITKNRGKNIIIYNVSRFCRNVNQGLELLDYALKCNTRLFFVEEGLVWDKNHPGCIRVLREKLYLAQEESAAIGRRVKDALAEKKRRGYFTGGIPRYGFKVVDADGGRRAVPDRYEQAVIKFINLCRDIGTSVRTLNEWMRNLSPNFDAPIELGYGGRKVSTLREGLTYREIADLLNDYEVTRRGNRWTASSVNTIGKRPYENVLEGLANMEL